MELNEFLIKFKLVDLYKMSFNVVLLQGKDDTTGEDLIQRDDDKPETVRKRLETYQDNTQPVLQYFR